MEVISKQEKSKSHQEFQKLLSEDLGKRNFKQDEIAIGTVSKIGKKFVFIEFGLKSEAAAVVENKKKQIEGIKSRYEGWKLNELDKMAKLKLKGKIDNINKFNLILNN